MYVCIFKSTYLALSISLISSSLKLLFVNLIYNSISFGSVTKKINFLKKISFSFYY